MTKDELLELKEHLEAQLGDAIMSAEIAFGELAITTSTSTVIPVLKFLRDDQLCQFLQLIDLCGVDYPERTKRFDVVYHLLSLHANQRIRVKVAVGEDQTIPTSIDVFPCANWFEREAFDMYGIQFEGHPDMRRILTDYGFEGYPLRKDFPLTGHYEVRYDDELSRVVYEPVQLTQEYRNFDYLSPWEGAEYVLPGDEKAE
ncbi:NADH-quinone oxidoreductase subunit C [Aquisalinus flavus]|uniref:NADH-quinone oxidoreductase subunit C n=1 Tax=Aquisalinus flavus TaxID=1526572 RepID=A0A8J2V2Y2_9PROT|nr:NADH-quinone oxidoreductase subunit C [Aquisalinus flavus]MBD0426643.1 NADH-quinone oxidoreductase subunit C [Aquisalinus flavus]UNE47814.1 NADH-quinone oxidoreductase subunit C [Aquisalinus flavus]GGD06234.1 NADH-quinone oxidoreductase subunit C 1 [Aquisalinus flavus]